MKVKLKRMASGKGSCGAAFNVASVLCIVLIVLDSTIPILCSDGSAASSTSVSESSTSGSGSGSGSSSTNLADWFGGVHVSAGFFGLFFGILFVGFGYRFYHLTNFCAGFIPITGFFYLILTLHTAISTAVALAIAIFVGLAFGVGTFLFTPAAHGLLGGFSGILLAAFIATTVSVAVFDWLVVLIIPLILAFFGVFMPKHITIFATSFCGSYGIMASIDYYGFGAAGFSGFFPKLLHSFENINPNWLTWLLVFCTILLTILGMIAQYCFTAKNYYPKPIVDLKIGSSTASYSEDEFESKSVGSDSDIETPEVPRKATYHDTHHTESSLPDDDKQNISERLTSLASGQGHAKPPTSILKKEQQHYGTL